MNYYWAHDDADQLLLAPLVQKPDWQKAFYQRVNGLFLLSHYQRAAWISRLGLNLDKTHLITNPIAYDRFEHSVTKLRDRRARAYYASTPYRGLKYLLQAWPLVRRLVPHAELEIFSSLEVNGESEGDEHRALYDQSKNTPGAQLPRRSQSKNSTRGRTASAGPRVSVLLSGD